MKIWTFGTVCGNDYLLVLKAYSSLEGSWSLNHFVHLGPLLLRNCPSLRLKWHPDLLTARRIWGTGRWTGSFLEGTSVGSAETGSAGIRQGSWNRWHCHWHYMFNLIAISSGQWFWYRFHLRTKNGFCERKYNYYKKPFPVLKWILVQWTPVWRKTSI